MLARSAVAAVTVRRTLVLAGLFGFALAAMAARPAQSDAASFQPERVLVAFQRGTPAAEKGQAHRAEGGRVENTLDWLNLDVVRLPPGADPLAAAERYERNPTVVYAQPNWEVHALSVPNDTLFNDQWGFHNTGQPVNGSPTQGIPDADIDGPEGWDAAFGAGSFPSSGGTRVGIVDTGIDQAHADLLNKTKACANALTGLGIIVEGSCADDNLHGTHVAGTVGALTNNSLGVAGTAPNSEFAIFKALNAAGSGFYADVIAGIHWVHTTGAAKVVSMSFGGPQDNALDQELSEAYNSGNGALLVAAAGNDGNSNLNWPAAHPDVVSVAATTARDERASFSNCNSDVEMAAPGAYVWSTTPGNGYASLSGTSMATPHVAGVGAMVMWAKGTNAGQTRDTIDGSADDLGAAGRDTCYGYGRANLARALGANVPPPPPAQGGAIAGKVSDVRSKTGIAGATVDCGSGGSTTTASDGSYSLTSVTPSTYTCKASATGYRSKSQSVTVSSGQTTTANFTLQRA